MPATDGRRAFCPAANPGRDGALGDWGDAGIAYLDVPFEIELKLETTPADLARLRGSPLLKGKGGTTERLVSHYFDTPDRTLHRAGYTLRVRATAHGRIQTVKLDAGHAGGLFVRPEWERPLKGPRPVIERDGPLAALVAARDLRVAFVTDVERDARNVSAGGALIEVALDDGSIRARKRKSGLCEVELELKGGAPEPLFALARELNALVPLRIGVRSKAERGYALAEGKDMAAAKAEPIALDSDADAREGFAAIAFACIHHFRRNEPRLLATGAVEALHQSRVALRRLRSSFSSFESLLAADARAHMLDEELRWLAGELGKVRDLDVLIPKIDGQGRRRLADARATALGDARTALDSLRARKLMIDLAEWLAIGAWRTRPAEPLLASEPVRAIARDILERHRKRLKKRGRHLAGLSDQARHKARIEAKKLRYAAEFFASLWTSKQAKARHDSFLKALEKLQDRLGELNDRATAADLLERHGVEVPAPDLGDKTLLRKAAKAFDDLMGIKPFWGRYAK